MYSISSFANSIVGMDTISNWQVYNGGELLRAFNAFTEEHRIILTKGNIRAIDSVEVNYFDDNPCLSCKASLMLKTKGDVLIKRIDNLNVNNHFYIKTTDLQVLAFKNRSSILKFYYKKDESDNERLLFEIEIR